MHETIGLSGTDCLWIFGKPYNLGGWDPVGLSLLYMVSVISSFLCISLNLRPIFDSCACVLRDEDEESETELDRQLTVRSKDKSCCIVDVIA